MILVTGGTGLLGAQVLFDLAKSGKKIRALRRGSSSDYVVKLVFSENPSLYNLIEWADGDVADPLSVSDALKGIEDVYHCAAKVSFQPGDYNQMMKVNVEGTANMVNLSLEEGVKKFCHVSSVAALGREAGNKNITEENVWKTSIENSNYAISKYGAEREVWRGKEEGLNVVIVNPTVIIGAGDWKSGSSQMFTQVWKGLRFYTEGVNGYVDVRDVSNCMIQLMEKNIFGERFIINAENLSYLEIISAVAASLNKKPPTIKAGKLLRGLAWRAEALKKKFTGINPLITKETARNSQHQWFPSNEKIKKRLGIEFLPVKDSIERTAKIFLRERANAH